MSSLGACRTGILVLCAFLAAPAYPVLVAGSKAKPGLVCAVMPGESFEQTIQRHYKSADAVFSGEVRSLTLEQATLRVIKVWKGNLAAEIVMSTGVRDNKDGTHTVISESFPFTNGASYVLFAYGKTADANRHGTLSTSICQPNVKLTAAGPTIAVLDKVVKKSR